jgi:antitoxin CptB
MSSETPVISEEEYKRIYWASRRGMLELDLILVPFFEQCFRDLSQQDQQCFIRLLEEEDTDLFAWFLGRGLPEDEELAAIVSLVHKHARGE